MCATPRPKKPVEPSSRTLATGQIVTEGILNSDLSGQSAAIVGLGILAALLGVGGIVAAIRIRGRRAEIAPTYGSTGGIFYTVVQIGCAGVLILGGLGLIAVVLLAKR